MRRRHALCKCVAGVVLLNYCNSLALAISWNRLLDNAVPMQLCTLQGVDLHHTPTHICTTKRIYQPMLKVLFRLHHSLYLGQKYENEALTYVCVPQETPPSQICADAHQ